jgi:hypothetical protein
LPQRTSRTQRYLDGINRIQNEFSEGKMGFVNGYGKGIIGGRYLEIHKG